MATEVYDWVEFHSFSHEPHGDPASRGIASRCPAGHWMTKTNMDLSELLAKQDGGDFLCAVEGRQSWIAHSLL